MVGGGLLEEEVNGKQSETSNVLDSSKAWPPTAVRITIAIALLWSLGHKANRTGVSNFLQYIMFL